MTIFVLAKEFHWTPDEIRKMPAKDIQAMSLILATYNKVLTEENKKKNKR